MEWGAGAFLCILCSQLSLIQTCPLLKTSAQVERRLLKEGFHRELETIVYLSSNEDISNCVLMLKENFPSGSYIDPYQLSFMKSFGGPDFYIPQVVNVETPEQHSPRIEAFMFGKLQSNIDNQMVMNITVPVHFRYHRARSGMKYSLSVPVVLEHPQVFLMCEDITSEDCKQRTQLEPCPPSGFNMCEYLPIHSFSTTEVVSGTVPVGDTDLIDTVLLTTTSLTFGAMLLALQTIAKKKRPKTHTA